MAGLALLAVAAAQSISVGVFILTPPPTPRRMAVSDVHAALTSEREARERGLTRRIVDSPPRQSGGVLAEMISVTLAEALDAPPSDVRVALVDDAIGPSEDTPIVVAAPGNGHRIADSRAIAETLMHPSVSQPSFHAAWRDDGARWIVVGPDDHEAALWRARILGSFGLALLVLAPLVWFAARRLTRPMRALARAAEEAGLESTQVAFPTSGAREIAVIVEALYAMKTRLRDQVDERVRMLAAVAHDLRTPLTGLRIRAEAAPPADRDRMAADIDRMEAMIAQVLAYAATGQVNDPRDFVDLAQVATDSARDFASRNLPVVFVRGEAAVCLGSSADLRRAVDNLVENAIRYGGGAEVATRARGTTAVVAVTDNGPGLPDADLDRMLEPFTRLEASRSRATGGAGLGLAIARGIARAHGGTLTLANRPGGGLVAEIVLPLASS